MVSGCIIRFGEECTIAWSELSGPAYLLIPIGLLWALIFGTLAAFRKKSIWHYSRLGILLAVLGLISEFLLGLLVSPFG